MATLSQSSRHTIEAPANKNVNPSRPLPGIFPRPLGYGHALYVRQQMLVAINAMRYQRSIPQPLQVLPGSRPKARCAKFQHCHRSFTADCPLAERMHHVRGRISAAAPRLVGECSFPQSAHKSNVRKADYRLINTGLVPAIEAGHLARQEMENSDEWDNHCRCCRPRRDRRYRFRWCRFSRPWCCCLDQRDQSFRPTRQHRLQFEQVHHRHLKKQPTPTKIIASRPRYPRPVYLGCP
jgi:hypothetical protein